MTAIDLLKHWKSGEEIIPHNADVNPNVITNAIIELSDRLDKLDEMVDAINAVLGSQFLTSLKDAGILKEGD